MTTKRPVKRKKWMIRERALKKSRMMMKAYSFSKIMSQK